MSAHPGCEFHQVAEALPLLEGEALGGGILDGRNRIWACCVAGVEPRFVEFVGDDPLRSSSRPTSSEGTSTNRSGRCARRGWPASFHGPEARSVVASPATLRRRIANDNRRLPSRDV